MQKGAMPGVSDIAQLANVRTDGVPDYNIV